jgi:hypothetical protein
MNILSTKRSRNAAAAALALTGSLLALAGVASTAGAPAGADPQSASAFVGVGADVTQDLYAAYTGASPAPPYGNTTFYTPISSSAATDDLTIQSFDANGFNQLTTQASGITTKAGGPAFDRPNSTTAGVAALEDSITATGWEAAGTATAPSYTGTPVSVTGQIDFARAARGPKGSGTNLTWIPFARDALGFIYYDHGDGTLSTLTLTTAQITAIYSSSNGEATITNDGNTDTVEGCLTITGSTPRSNLESLTGITDSTSVGYAGCNQLTQNSGNAFESYASTLPAGTDAIIPISSGSWIGQANGVGVDRSNLARGVTGYGLATIQNAGGTVLGQPYTLGGTGGTTEIPNTTYYQDAHYGYNIYTVVPGTDLSGLSKNNAIISLFSGPTSALCSSAAQATANLFGFDSLVAGEGTCGSTTQKGSA